MKKIFFTLTFSLLVLFLKADYWTQKADFGGTPRADGTGFSIGTKGYIGTGFINPTYSTDWWEYNPATNSWIQKANYGGSPIVESSSFVIDNFGYILSAPSGVDFWQFDPVLNVWTQMANFAGSARQAAVAFTINGRGYITTGLFAGSLDDLWEYNPVTNAWLQKTNLAGAARHYAAGFAIGNKGYVGTGQTATSVGMTDLWEYDQPTDSWTQKANFPGVARREASAFAIGNSGYLGMGSGLGGYFFDFYQYDPVTNTWTQKADFGGGPREEAAQFSIGGLGYVGTGYDGVAPGVMKKDFWEYHPEDSTTEISDLEFRISDFTIYPNPFSISTTISLNAQFEIRNSQLRIFDLAGREVYCQAITSQQFEINCNKLKDGEYVLAIFSDGKKVASKKVIKDF